MKRKECSGRKGGEKREGGGGWGVPKKRFPLPEGDRDKKREFLREKGLATAQKKSWQNRS